jgi:dolichyl-phosphate-mannose--protein O-mannosyl transferase
LPGFVLEHGRAVLVLLAAALAFLAPWVLTRRDSYLYHFLPSYTALVLLLAGLLGALARARPKLALAFLCVVGLVAGLYGPLWCSLPMSPASARARLFLERWR